jgi:hypothetical protein
MNKADAFQLKLYSRLRRTTSKVGSKSLRHFLFFHLLYQKPFDVVICVNILIASIVGHRNNMLRYLKKCIFIYLEKYSFFYVIKSLRHFFKQLFVLQNIQKIQFLSRKRNSLIS